MNKRIASIAAVLCAAALLAGGIARGEEEGTGRPPAPSTPRPAFSAASKRISRAPPRAESLAETDRLVCENSRLALYLDEEAFIVKILDKQGDYVWSSSATETELASMTGTWRRFSQAFLTMDYFNANGASLRSSARFDKAAADLLCTEDGLAATLTFREPDATARVYLSLTEDGFKVRIPDEEIVFNKPDHRLGKLYVLPFLGSAYSNTIPGYFFIPDGCGALMRFDEPKTYNSSTLLRVYGPDVSVQAPAAYQNGLAPTPTKTCSSRSTARYMAPTRTGFSASSRAAKPMPASKSARRGQDRLPLDVPGFSLP